MVDSNDRERVDETREELHRAVDELRDAPLLVLANKQVSYKNHNKGPFTLHQIWERHGKISERFLLYKYRNGMFTLVKSVEGRQAFHAGEIY